MKESMPRYRFLRTEGGSGPIVFYRAPTLHARIASDVFFQKGLHGADWLRANYAHYFVDARKKQHDLGQASLPDLRYKTDQELTLGIARLLPTLDEAVVAQARAATRLVPRLGKLFDGLPKHAARWMKEAGRALAADDFDEDSFAEPAFDRFKAWLKREKLLVDAADLAVWHWWTDHHPTP
jgi:hypothetical protein